MKTIRVVAAVIRAVNNENKPVIFATQRGYGEFKGGWEFPGGKIESGETPQQALKREIMGHLADVKWLPADVTLIEKIGEALYETKNSKEYGIFRQKSEVYVKIH